MKNRIYIALICAFSILLAVSSGFLIKHYIDSEKQSELYDNLIETIEKTDTEKDTMTYSQDKSFLSDYQDLYLQNNDMVGWIKIEDTKINYPDFIFINRFGQAQHQATLNKAIRRIIRDCNDEQFEKSEEPEVLLPHFSCHSLRHTFTTRMCEAGVNIKVIQDALGHTDISTTLNIYTDVTKELKTSEFKGLDNYFKAQ